MVAPELNCCALDSFRLLTVSSPQIEEDPFKCRATAGLYLDNKWWMKLSLSHPPESRRLHVAGSVCWIIIGLDLREPLHAGGMDFGYAVFERSALNLIFDLAILQSAFKGD